MQMFLSCSGTLVTIDERRMKTVLQAKVVNPQTGLVLPLGHIGEIMTRGYCVMLEYWGDRAKTEESMTKSGWYKTG